tara:strand:- start:243 stop:785 length:543 start_codon:yes stop_codon:yes gene_type:complete
MKKRLVCQLSDQKQTPVYFPINDNDNDTSGELNIKPEERNNIRHAHVSIDITIAFVWAIICFAMFAAGDDNIVLNSMGAIYEYLSKPFYISLAIFALGSFIVWSKYKDSLAVTPEFYGTIAVFYLISSFIFNFIILVILFILLDKMKHNSKKQLQMFIASLVFFGLIKCFLISHWFLIYN